MSATLAETTLAPWRRHNLRLAVWSVTSIAIGVALWFGAVTPDGRDPWYGAIAIQFVVWGIIDLAFAISGFRGVSRIRSLAEEEQPAVALEKVTAIGRLLRTNAWFNALWLAIGLALVIGGYVIWSASLVGHGVGVLEQAIVLVILDSSFARGLRSSIAAVSGGRQFSATV